MHLQIPSKMNTKYLAVLFFIASAAAMELIDPFYDARNLCRSKYGFSEKQLAKTKYHLDVAGEYLYCWVQAVGIPCDENGQLDVDVTVKVVELVLPPVLSRPIVIYCNDRVLKSGVQGNAPQAVIFTICLRKKLPNSLFDVLGLLKKPVYPRLKRW